MSAEAFFSDGVQKMAAGDDSGAESAFLRALGIEPDLMEALVNLGLLRQRAGADGEAEAYFRQALASHPACFEVLLNLSVFLLRGKRFVEAEALNLKALRIVPESEMAWSNYGVLLACQKREAEAEQSYRTAIGLDPDYRKARFNLAYVLLRQARFEEGWACLEARDWYALFDRYFAFPRWQGETLAGKSLIIACEAGHGDMIQFTRYVPLLKRLGALKVSLVCHPGLKTLLSTLRAVDQVFALDEEIPDCGWDYWSPALSLPGYCGTTIRNIPAEIPYLGAQPERVAYWRARLPNDGLLRVGLVWKGNPNFENDADRSLPALAYLAPLASVPSVRYVSLQKGAGESEALNPPSSLNLLALGHELTDFADTAALLACLDLVICVDTAVAHLAGALGLPCWILLPDYKTDWRWLSDRSDSPWYSDSMRLFRQSADGQWSSLIAVVAETLRAWAREKQRS